MAMQKRKLSCALAKEEGLLVLVVTLTVTSLSWQREGIYLNSQEECGASNEKPCSFIEVGDSEDKANSFLRNPRRS